MSSDIVVLEQDYWVAYHLTRTMIGGITPPLNVEDGNLLGLEIH
jgi:hypothetical protein